MYHRDKRTFNENILYMSQCHNPKNIDLIDELLKKVNKLNNKYTFIESKRIKDEDYKQYELLKNID